jgi:DNA mismatch endonuclease, patch repair protein
MVDIVSPEKRSLMMGQIRARNTMAELMVRSYLHRAGLRFKANDRSLPGSPDLVFPKYRSVVFVHGCFWHRHHGCRLAAVPATRVEFWNAKFAANVVRDERANSSLQALGWRTFTIWECEVHDLEMLDALFWKVVGG